MRSIKILIIDFIFIVVPLILVQCIVYLAVSGLSGGAPPSFFSILLSPESIFMPLEMWPITAPFALPILADIVTLLFKRRSLGMIIANKSQVVDGIFILLFIVILVGIIFIAVSIPRNQKEPLPYSQYPSHLNVLNQKQPADLLPENTEEETKIAKNNSGEAVNAAQNTNIKGTINPNIRRFTNTRYSYTLLHPANEVPFPEEPLPAAEEAAIVSIGKIIISARDSGDENAWSKLPLKEYFEKMKEVNSENIVSTGGQVIDGRESYFMVVKEKYSSQGGGNLLNESTYYMYFTDGELNYEASIPASEFFSSARKMMFNTFRFYYGDESHENFLGNSGPSDAVIVQGYQQGVPYRSHYPYGKNCLYSIYYACEHFKDGCKDDSILNFCSDQCRQSGGLDRGFTRLTDVEAEYGGVSCSCTSCSK